PAAKAAPAPLPRQCDSLRGARGGRRRGLGRDRWLARPGSRDRGGVLRRRHRVELVATRGQVRRRQEEQMSTTKTIEATVEALCGDLSNIHAPRGNELNARSWATEAPLRMLLNNLDPEVAERPEELIVYGGSGRAARNHESLRAIVRTLLTLGDEDTLL